MRKEELTDTEKDFAYMISRGYTIKQIADKHGLTLEQTKWILRKIKKKTRLEYNVDIARAVIRGKLDLG